MIFIIVGAILLLASRKMKRHEEMNLILPLEGKITQKFKGLAHNGVDIAVVVGTPIFAPASGVIKSAGFDKTFGGGNFIIIQHHTPQVTGYAHLSKISVKVGQEVAQGDIIGYSGNTGTSTGPHLHFTLTVNGVLTNPLDYYEF